MIKIWAKRISALLLAVVLTVMLSIPALAVGRSSTVAKSGETYYVIATRLNVRTGPGTEYGVKDRIKKGTKVVFKSMTKGWWKVSYGNGKTGYVDKQYLTRSNASKTGTYTVKTTLNVRNYPRSKAKRIGVLYKGAQVKLLQLNGDWARINYKGHTGWVCSKYLSK